MSDHIFNYGSAGRYNQVDDEGRLLCDANASTSGYIFGYGDTGYPVVVNGTGRLLIHASGLAASDIENDSLASGTTVQEALNSILVGSGNYYVRGQDLLPPTTDTDDIGSDSSRFAIIFAQSGNFENGIEIGSSSMHIGPDYIRGIRTDIDDSTGNVIMSGSVTSSTYYGDGSNLQNVGAAAANALTISAKVNEAAGITIGQAVYFSGAVGQFPQVSLCNNLEQVKNHCIGLAAETKTDGQTILVRIAGNVAGVNTSDWGDGDGLYVSYDGNLVNVIPSSGVVRHIGHVAYSHVSQGIITVKDMDAWYIAMPSTQDLDIRMGDNSGVNKVVFENFDDSEVASIDSVGTITGASGNFTNGMEVQTAQLHFDNNDVAIGRHVLSAGGDGYNIAIGTNCLTESVTGGGIVAIGYFAHDKGTGGFDNIAIGTRALEYNDVGDGSIALGYRALRYAASGDGDIALGSNALYSCSLGSDNIAIGTSALGSTDEGSNNIAIGWSCLNNITDGIHNVCGGIKAVFSATQCNHNVVQGGFALYNATNILGNVAIGYNAGASLLTGNGNIVIGSGADINNGLENATAIGMSAVASGSNTLRLGDNTTAVQCENIEINNGLRLNRSAPPAAQDSAGTPGDVAWASGYLYVCVDTDFWQRSPLSAW